MIDRITSRQNAKIKQAAKLRTRKGRENQRRIIIDGIREVQRAIDSGVGLHEIFFTEHPELDETIANWTSNNDLQQVQFTSTGTSVFEKISFGNRSRGVVAVATTPDLSLQNLPAHGNHLLVIIEGVEKPGNVGAILRSADAAGVEGVIICDGGTDIFNPNTIRASLGTIFTTNISAASRTSAIDWLEKTQTDVFVARVDGADHYVSHDYTRRTAFVLGSEAEGVSEMWKTPRFIGVKLPMHGAADSLNVSATAAVLFYEARRQKNLQSLCDGMSNHQ